MREQRNTRPRQALRGNQGDPTVLKAHKERLDPELVIDEPVKLLTRKRGIVDLMYPDRKSGIAPTITSTWSSSLKRRRSSSLPRS